MDRWVLRGGWVLLITPWLFVSESLHIRGLQPWIIPTQMDFFVSITDFLHGLRLVWPMQWHGIVLILASFANLILLSLLFITFYKLIEGHPLWKCAAAFLFCSLFYSKAHPGTFDPLLAEKAFGILLLWPVIKNPSSITTWFIATGLVIIGSHHASLSFALGWTAFSLILSAVIDFLFIERGLLLRKQKKQMLATALSILAPFILGLWVVLSTWSHPEIKSVLGFSKDTWMIAVVCSLSLYLTWKKPNEILSWLRALNFSIGYFLSPTLQWPVFLLLLFLLSKVVTVLFEQEVIRKKMGFLFSRGSMVTAGLFILIISGFFIKESYKNNHTRELKPLWVQTLNQLPQKSEASYWIIGRSLPYLYSFHPGKFIESEELIFEKNETTMAQWMNQRNLKEILIDVPYLKQRWQEWIAKGNPPEFLNQSVLSRLIIYEGQEQVSRSLSIAAIKKFELKKSPVPNLAWVVTKEAP